MKNVASLRWMTGFVAAGMACVLILVGCSTTKQNAAAAPQGSQIVGLRRLTDVQYRNAIADIFGTQIEVNGRFEPIFRPMHSLVAVGAATASISPTGLEQFDAMGRGVAAQVFSERNRSGYMRCEPQDAAAPDDTCARATLSWLGRYLFRRPLTETETALYVRAAHEATTTTNSFYKGLELSLAAMLTSPNFLYIVESAEPDPTRPGSLRLDSYARAARLSFTLWNTTPDEALLAAAERGELANDGRLRAMARQMVASPRFEQGVSAFMSDMLVSEKFDDLSKDPIIYPLFNTIVASAMTEQLRRTIVDHLVTRNGDYRQLFTTRHTFMTRALGPAYGVRVASTDWEPYDFAPDADRAGILTQGAFLALYAHPGRSSATLRGRAVRELLMCQAVPDPPGDVSFDVVQDTNNPIYPTARERLGAHATNPTCASCHRVTDPIGLPLETFDGMGIFRTRENNEVIDASGALDGAQFDGAVGLGEALAANPATTACVARRAIEYTTGRNLAHAHDADGVLHAFAASGYRVRDLFFQVVTDPAFYSVASQAQPREHASRD